MAVRQRGEHQLVAALQGRYRRADRVGKARLLDEFCGATGYHAYRTPPRASHNSWQASTPAGRPSSSDTGAGVWPAHHRRAVASCGSSPADSPSALAVKRERVPPQLLALAGAGALVGTPEQAVERLQALVCAGCQYFSFAVLDPDTLRLLAERVVPAVAPVASTAQPMER